jgi:hypothetical protein
MAQLDALIEELTQAGGATLKEAQQRAKRTEIGAGAGGVASVTKQPASWSEGAARPEVRAAMGGQNPDATLSRPMTWAIDFTSRFWSSLRRMISGSAAYLSCCTSALLVST